MAYYRRKGWKGGSSYNYGRGYQTGYTPQQYGPQPRQQKRRTGCKRSSYTNKDGDTRSCITAFRPDPYTRNGWQNALAVPRLDPVPENGNMNYEKWVVTITDSMGKRTFNGIYNKNKGFVTIPDLGLIMSPNGKGSFGRIKKNS